jgi:hypothetical protein
MRVVKDGCRGLRAPLVLFTEGCYTHTIEYVQLWLAAGFSSWSAVWKVVSWGL